MPVIVKRKRQIKRYYRYRVRKAYELMYNELKNMKCIGVTVMIIASMIDFEIVCTNKLVAWYNEPGNADVIATGITSDNV